MADQQYAKKCQVLFEWPSIRQLTQSGFSAMTQINFDLGPCVP